jgi:hypothetical protein
MTANIERKPLSFSYHKLVFSLFKAYVDVSFPRCFIRAILPDSDSIGSTSSVARQIGDLLCVDGARYFLVGGMIHLQALESDHMHYAKTSMGSFPASASVE